MVLMTDGSFEFEEKDVNQKAMVSFEWLRENCRCSTCYNEATNQRIIRIFDFDPHIKPVMFNTSGRKFVVNWNDGHQSVYDLEWILSQIRFEEMPPEKLWAGDVSSEIEHVSATEMKSQHGVTRLIKSLLQHGIGFVTNVKPDLVSTEEVIRCIGPPQQTLFGDMWEVSDQMDHEDTAYTNQALDPHTDTCYFTQPAGLIIFHCIKRNCTGGQTLLVDGFRAAKQVEKESPEHYKCLQRVHTEYQYIEKGHHLACMTPVIHHRPDGNIKQIRFNLYDRSARLVQPSSDTTLFYASLRHLASVIGEPGGHWWLTLQPGTVAFINNWHVLHGRSAYSGSRTIAGAFVSMGNLLSAARLFKVLL